MLQKIQSYRQHRVTRPDETFYMYPWIFPRIERLSQSDGPWVIFVAMNNFPNVHLSLFRSKYTKPNLISINRNTYLLLFQVEVRAK